MEKFIVFPCDKKVKIDFSSEVVESFGESNEFPVQYEYEPYFFLESYSHLREEEFLKVILFYDYLNSPDKLSQLKIDLFLAAFKQFSSSISYYTSEDEIRLKIREYLCFLENYQDIHRQFLIALKFLFFSVRRSSIIPLHSNEIKVRIDADGFSLKNDYDNFAKERMTQEQIDLAITNLDDSYFKRVFITISGGNIIGEKKYVIDGLTFMNEELSIGKDEGEEINEEYISFSKYETYLPGEAPSDIRTKFIIPHVVGRRKFTIRGGDYTIECELCRENHIHVNDLSFTFGGERNPFSFDGLAINGEIKISE